MATSKNILTIEEALTAVYMDEDYDGAVSTLLSEIDRVVEVSTGVRWQDSVTIEPLAKTVARVRLKVLLGRIVPQIELDRELGAIKQLQLLATRYDATTTNTTT